MERPGLGLVDLGDEPEDEDILARDPKEWKSQDHYAVLGLSELRFKATDEQIKIARAYFPYSPSPWLFTLDRAQIVGKFFDTIRTRRQVKRATRTTMVSSSASRKVLSLLPSYSLFLISLFNSNGSPLEP